MELNKFCLQPHQSSQSPNPMLCGCMLEVCSALVPHHHFQSVEVVIPFIWLRLQQKIVKQVCICVCMFNRGSREHHKEQGQPKLLITAVKLIRWDFLFCYMLRIRKIGHYLGNNFTKFLLHTVLQNHPTLSHACHWEPGNSQQMCLHVATNCPKYCFSLKFKAVSEFLCTCACAALSRAFASVQGTCGSST